MGNPNLPIKGDYNVYVGARYVPVPMGKWDKTIAYEPLMIVMDETGNTWVSKTYVPKNTELEDDDYWVRTADFNLQLEYYRNEVIKFKNDVDESEAEYYAKLEKQLNDAINELNTKFSDLKKDLIKTLGFVTPEDFGAKGDGVTDDTEAVQQAFDSDKPVRLLAKSRYYITKQLNLTVAKAVYGESPVTTAYGLWEPTYFPTAVLVTDTNFSGENVIRARAEHGSFSLFDFGICNKAQTAENKYVPTYNGLRIIVNSAYVNGIAVRGYNVGVFSDVQHLSQYTNIFSSANVINIFIKYTSDSIFDHIYSNTNSFMESFIAPSAAGNIEKVVGVLCYGSHRITNGKIEWCSYGLVTNTSYLDVENIIFDWNKEAVVTQDNDPGYRIFLNFQKCWFMTRDKYLTNNNPHISITFNSCIFSISDGSAHDTTTAKEGSELMPDTGISSYHQTNAEEYISFNNCDISHSAVTSFFAYVPFTKVYMSGCITGTQKIGNVPNLINYDELALKANNALFILAEETVEFEAGTAGEWQTKDITFASGTAHNAIITSIGNENPPAIGQISCNINNGTKTVSVLRYDVTSTGKYLVTIIGNK